MGWAASQGEVNPTRISIVAKHPPTTYNDRGDDCPKQLKNNLGQVAVIARKWYQNNESQVFNTQIY